MPLVMMTYDVENRLVRATHTYNGTDHYVCDPSNRRFWNTAVREMSFGSPVTI